MQITTLEQLILAIERVVNELDSNTTDTYLTQTAADNLYLGVSDTAVRASTADLLTTRRVLTISDNSVTNKGPGVYFSGGANVNIKLPNKAIFDQLTTTNLVLGTTPSNTEDAIWIEWS